MEKQQVSSILAGVMWPYLRLWVTHTHVQASAGSWVHPSQHSWQRGSKQHEMQP